MTENFANFYATTLVGAISNVDTLLEVASPVGAPDVNFRLLVQDGVDDPTNRELMMVTAKAGDEYTVSRGIEGTTAVAHGAGSFVAHVVTAGGLLQGIFDRVTNVQATIAVVIDGGDGAITSGVKADLAISFAANIDSWELLADRVGSIQIDIWKDTTFPPTDADSITGSSPPSITSDDEASDADLSDWGTVTISPGDRLRFNVDSATTIVRATLLLHVTRA